jgi:agmatine deiminase
MEQPTPASLGYVFPPEWAPHRATWLSWIHKEESWPGKLHTAYPPYIEFIKALTPAERVCINVAFGPLKDAAKAMLLEAGADLSQIDFFDHPTNDAWCRDHGPAFLINEQAKERKVIVDWGYNAWGDKYPPYDLDDVIPTKVGAALGLPVFHPGIVMEGGSIEVNGAGTLLTTRACLLNKNRNPLLSQAQIEDYLRSYYGQQHILWLEDGIVGDDTDGHIDDLTRFVNEDTVVTVVEHDTSDANYHILHDNLDALKAMRLSDGRKLNIIELPMPRPVEYEGQRLPASYANFYIGNGVVVVPIFQDKADDKALQIMEGCFPGRKVVGINSRDLIWGLGSFHCLSQQEPM